MRIPLNDPTTSGTAAQLDPATEVDRQDSGERDFTQRPLPVVLPPWLRSLTTARATLWWALRYAGRHLGFHLVRAPGYGLALCWWTLRGAARGITTALRWVTMRREYRPLVTAAREAKRWELVRDLISERRALARTRIITTAWLALSAGASCVAGFLTWGRTLPFHFSDAKPLSSPVLSK